MQHISIRIRLGGAALLLCLTTPLVFADTVNMKITKPLYNWAGVNVSPYAAEITKVNTVTQTPTLKLNVVCLDIAENTPLNDPLLYDVSPPAVLPNVGAVPSTKAMYDGAARLAAQLLATPTPQQDSRGKLAFAIWYIFDPGAFTHANGYLTVGLKDQIVQLAADAIAGTTSVSYTVYTPIPLNGDGTLKSQRMMGNVSVPEPSAVALLALDMSGLLGMVVVLRRRFRRPE